MSGKVVAGGAGHWYALLSSGTLVGWPMGAHDDPEADKPAHPERFDGAIYRGEWYEITDPAPECDDAAIIAELKR